MELNKVYNGDCIKVMREFPDNSVDAIVTDPPAGISFMGKSWDTFDKNMFGKKGEEGENDLKVKKNFEILPRYGNADLVGFQNFICEVFTEAIRVLKPGGYALVWAIPRTSHHTAMGLERAGFEIRDCVYHVFGSGFPKSLDISKAIDKQNGTFKEGELSPNTRSGVEGDENGYDHSKKITLPNPQSSAAKQWQGWGTALKPSVECWWLCRKPLSEPTVAANVLKYGTGGINIDGCRVEYQNEQDRIEGQSARISERHGNNQVQVSGSRSQRDHIKGRFPANLILDGSDEVVKGFPNTAPSKAGMRRNRNTSTLLEKGFEGEPKDIYSGHHDSGSATRFFYKADWTDEELEHIRQTTDEDLQKKWMEIAGKYDDIDIEPIEAFIASLIYMQDGNSRIKYCAKASKSERNAGLEGFEEIQPDLSRKEGNPGGDNPRNRGVNKVQNHHPTVKPIALMRYLCRLITPPDGICLDPFAGSGSTLIAAKQEGFNYIGIELSEEYCRIAEKRIEQALAQRKLW